MKGFQLSGSQQFVGSVLLRLAEGRQPWSSSSLTVRPQQELADAESGIWALAAPQTPGGLILGGTEEGMVMAWDLRMSSPAWQVLLVVWCLWHSPTVLAPTSCSKPCSNVRAPGANIS